VRVDGYSAFGRAWSPSVSGGVWISPDVRLRASAARAFRIPTYTERYYSDPAHLATADLRPEHGWSVDAGLDWLRAGWLLSATGFRRWDEDVIDWVKAAPADRWNTTNVRDVTTTGIEASLSRSWNGAVVRLLAASLDVDAPTLDLLSKYVLEYARHSVGASIGAPVGGGLRAAGTIDHRRRFGAEAYTLVGLRVSREIARGSIFVDVSNLLDVEYVEIPGVAMPGRWLTVGVTIR
jgi:iron complex outermembrane receptor protein